MVGRERDDLRLREEKILEQREVLRLETVDHGQVVKYLGDRSVETAKNGLQRVGLQQVKAKAHDFSRGMKPTRRNQSTLGRCPEFYTH